MDFTATQNPLAAVSSNQKWLLALVLTLIALIVFAPLTMALFGYAVSGMGFNPQITSSGAATVALYLVMAVVYLVFARLIYEWLAVSTQLRWKYALITLVVALIVFAPFFASAMNMAFGSTGGWLVFAIQLIVFFLLVRLTLM